MLKCYNKSGKKNPISFGTKFSDWHINGTVINAHFGAGSLVKYEFFNNPFFPWIIKIVYWIMPSID